MAPFNLRRRSHFPWLFAVLSALANGIVLIAAPAKFSPELFLSITGSVAALVHFLYMQHSGNTDRFINLFREFNVRYDRLNEALNELVLRDRGSLLSLADKQVLFDYFNLCAEEFLYFKSGYIDAEVWRSWLSGMRLVAAKADLRRLWEEELSTGSYYEFSLAIIDASQ